MTGSAAASLATAAAAAAEPLPETPDPASIFESVTVTQDVAPPPPTMSLLPPARPPRKLAIIGLSAGLGIVALGFAGFKLLGGTKPTPARNAVAAAKPVEASPKAEEAQVAAPAAAPAIAAAAEAPAPAEREAPARGDADETAPARADHKRAHRSAAAAVAAADRVAPHRAGAAHRGKGREKHGSRMKVVVYHPAKRAAPEHADPRTPYEHGNALLFAGDGKGAIAAYREAVRSAPTDPIGFRGLGLAYEQQGESAQAVRALRRYLKLAPNAADREIISRRIERLSKPAKKS
jgi:tetratricopeptide (TPR) repeat protein